MFINLCLFVCPSVCQSVCLHVHVSVSNFCETFSTTFELLVDAHQSETLCMLHKIPKINYYSGNLHIVRNFILSIRLRNVQQPGLDRSQAARQETANAERHRRVRISPSICSEHSHRSLTRVTHSHFHTTYLFGANS